MAIEARNITKRFGDFVALDDVSVVVPEGALTALLGPSGGGKSTLLRIIAGLERPDSGVVCIEGQDMTGVSPQQRGVGFVFQHYAAFKHMTVRGNVAFGLTIRKRPTGPTSPGQFVSAYGKLSSPAGSEKGGWSRPAAGPCSRGASSPSGSCWGRGGPTRSWGGGATGPGIRSRTPRSSPG